MQGRPSIKKRVAAQDVTQNNKGMTKHDLHTIRYVICPRTTFNHIAAAPTQTSNELRNRNRQLETE